MPDKTRRDFLGDMMKVAAAAKTGSAGVVDSLQPLGDAAKDDDTDEDGAVSDNDGFGPGLSVWIEDAALDSYWWNAYRHDAVGIRMDDGHGDRKYVELPEPVVEDLDHPLLNQLLSVEDDTTIPAHYSEGPWYENIDEARLRHVEEQTGLESDQLFHRITGLADAARQMYLERSDYQSEPTKEDRRMIYDIGSWNEPDGKEEWLLPESSLFADMPDGYSPFDNFDLWKRGDTYTIQFHNRSTEPRDVLPPRDFYDVHYGDKDTDALTRDQQVLYAIAARHQYGSTTEGLNNA